MKKHLLIDAIRRILYLILIFIYSILIFIPFIIYLFYGFPRYLLLGDSKIDETWMCNNFILENIYKEEVK